VRRNDPCPCGSGKKVKSCCVEHLGILAGDKEPAYAYVLLNNT